MAAGKGKPGIPAGFKPGSPTELSEHPPASVKQGMAWTVARVNAVAQSKYWATTAIAITWDDFKGGWYDHVTAAAQGCLDRVAARRPGRLTPTPSLGLMVRGLVVWSSAHTQTGYFQSVSLHVSLVKFCEVTFGLLPLNARDAARTACPIALIFPQPAALRLEDSATNLWRKRRGAQRGPRPSPASTPARTSGANF